MIITAYIPLSKNAGIKLTAIFALESVLYLVSTIFCIALALFFSGGWYLSGNPSNDSTT
jgi:hypothetical protein